jgi:hypothetical protein
MTPGEIAYNAYCQRRGWKSFHGEQLPPFIRQSSALMDAWEDAATAVVGEVRSTQLAPPRDRRSKKEAK